MNKKQHLTLVASALLIGSFFMTGVHADNNGLGNSQVEQRLAELEAPTS